MVMMKSKKVTAVKKAMKKTAPKKAVAEKAQKPTILSKAEQAAYFSFYHPDCTLGEQLMEAQLSQKQPVGKNGRKLKTYFPMQAPHVTLNQHLYWGPGCAGNGVFSTKSHKAGDIVEVGPVLIDTTKGWADVQNTKYQSVHADYLIGYDPERASWQKLNYGCNEEAKEYQRFDKLYKTGLKPGKVEFDCLMLGFGSLYNHCDKNHVDVEFGPNNTFIMRAIRDIRPHEEIFLDYGPNYWPTAKGMKDVNKKKA